MNSSVLVNFYAAAVTSVDPQKLDQTSYAAEAQHLLCTACQGLLQVSRQENAQLIWLACFCSIQEKKYNSVLYLLHSYMIQFRVK